VPFATLTGKSNVIRCFRCMASVSSVAWVPQVGQLDRPLILNSVGAPRKRLPQGGSDVVTPLQAVTNTVKEVISPKRC